MTRNLRSFNSLVLIRSESSRQHFERYSSHCRTWNYIFKTALELLHVQLAFRSECSQSIKVPLTTDVFFSSTVCFLRVYMWYWVSSRWCVFGHQRGCFRNKRHDFCFSPEICRLAVKLRELHDSRGCQQWHSSFIVNRATRTTGTDCHQTGKSWNAFSRRKSIVGEFDYLYEPNWNTELCSVVLVDANEFD